MIGEVWKAEWSGFVGEYEGRRYLYTVVTNSLWDNPNERDKNGKPFQFCTECGKHIRTKERAFTWELNYATNPSGMPSGGWQCSLVCLITNNTTWDEKSNAVKEDWDD